MRDSSSILRDENTDHDLTRSLNNYIQNLSNLNSKFLSFNENLREKNASLTISDPILSESVKLSSEKLQSKSTPTLYYQTLNEENAMPKLENELNKSNSSLSESPEENFFTAYVNSDSKWSDSTGDFADSEIFKKIESNEFHSEKNPDLSINLQTKSELCTILAYSDSNIFNFDLNETLTNSTLTESNEPLSNDTSIETNDESLNKIETNSHTNKTESTESMFGSEIESTNELSYKSPVFFELDQNLSSPIQNLSESNTYILNCEENIVDLNETSNLFNKIISQLVENLNSPTLTLSESTEQSFNNVPDKPNSVFFEFDSNLSESTLDILEPKQVLFESNKALSVDLNEFSSHLTTEQIKNKNNENLSDIEVDSNISGSNDDISRSSFVDSNEILHQKSSTEFKQSLIDTDQTFSWDINETLFIKEIKSNLSNDKKIVSELKDTLLIEVLNLLNSSTETLNSIELNQNFSNNMIKPRLSQNEIRPEILTDLFENLEKVDSNENFPTSYLSEPKKNLNVYKKFTIESNENINSSQLTNLTTESLLETNSDTIDESDLSANNIFRPELNANLSTSLINMLKSKTKSQKEIVDLNETLNLLEQNSSKTIEESKSPLLDSSEQFFIDLPIENESNFEIFKFDSKLTGLNNQFSRSNSNSTESIEELYNLGNSPTLTKFHISILTAQKSSSETIPINQNSNLSINIPINTSAFNQTLFNSVPELMFNIPIVSESNASLSYSETGSVDLNETLNLSQSNEDIAKFDHISVGTPSILYTPSPIQFEFHANLSSSASTLPEATVILLNFDKKLPDSIANLFSSENNLSGSFTALFDTDKYLPKSIANLFTPEPKTNDFNINKLNSYLSRSEPSLIRSNVVIKESEQILLAANSNLKNFVKSTPVLKPLRSVKSNATLLDHTSRSETPITPPSTPKMKTSIEDISHIYL